MDDSKLRSEVVNLFQYIQRLREEVAAMAKPGEDGSAFDSMSAQLDAIVTATEDATNAILKATETIDETASALRDEKDPQKVSALCDALSQESMAIMEACSFQDITGQRITKIVRSMKFVEERVDKMVELWGRKEIEAVSSSLDLTTEEEERDKRLHLSGPQMADEAISQDDIDALFD
ncbi:MAG: protein phosphatase CheZ [Alphaproteobacteria bacterium]